MLKRSVWGAAIFLSIVASALAQSATPTKGYELYSWKLKGHWHYALLPKTDHPKTTAEVTAKETERVGMDAIKQELKSLPSGETVTWMSAVPGTSRQRVGKTVVQLPSRHRINRLKAYCEKVGVTLSLQ